MTYLLIINIILQLIIINNIFTKDRKLSYKVEKILKSYDRRISQLGDMIIERIEIERLSGALSKEKGDSLKNVALHLK